MTHPLPSFYDPKKVETVYNVDYNGLAALAPEYRQKNGIRPASADPSRTWLLLIDVQNTFCIPSYELFVSGRSGTGAVEDNRRLAEFIYKNIDRISHITATLDTHSAQQIFHPVFFVDAAGNHPAPFTDIHAEDTRSGKWRFNPALAVEMGIAPEYGQQMLQHYTESLEKKGKYALTVWPYHAMQGGIGHAIVPAIEEAIFFHGMLRYTQPEFEIKGQQPFTENYSAIGPEVLTGPMGESLGSRNSKFVQRLQEVDKLIIAGQAKSHCVAWTIADLLEDIQQTDPSLAGKVYLLEDCASAVVVPGVVDHTPAADEAYTRFAAAGMQVVKSADTGWL